MRLPSLTNDTQFSLIAFQLLVPKHSVTEPFAANSYILKVRVLMKSGSGVVQMGPQQRWGTPAAAEGNREFITKNTFFIAFCFTQNVPGLTTVDSRATRLLTPLLALTVVSINRQNFFFFSRGNTPKGVKVTVLMLRLKWDMTGIN